MKGYIKLSVSLLNDQDSKIELGPETYDSKMQNNKELVEIPPSIVLKMAQLKIICIRGENFPKLDMVGAGIDAYMKFSLGSISIKTSVSKSLSPYWNEEILIPIMEPSYISQLKMEVCDKDLIGKDDVVGSRVFDIAKIKQGAFKKFGWSHLYGAPDGSSKKQTQLMFEYPSRGRFN